MWRLARTRIAIGIYDLHGIIAVDRLLRHILLLGSLLEKEIVERNDVAG